MALGLPADGITDFVWLALWLKFYRRPEEHKGLSKAEFDYIRSDPQEPSVHVPWKNFSLQADLGVRGGQVPDRSDLVVLPVLAAQVSGDARAVAQNCRTPAVTIYWRPISEVSAAGGCRRR
jgi:hypothetical protein